MLQEVERQQRTQLMQSMRSLPVHKKSTFSSQIQATVIRDTGLEQPTRKSEPKKRYEAVLGRSGPTTLLLHRTAMFTSCRNANQRMTYLLMRASVRNAMMYNL